MHFAATEFLTFISKCIVDPRPFAGSGGPGADHRPPSLSYDIRAMSRDHATYFYDFRLHMYRQLQVWSIMYTRCFEMLVLGSFLENVIIILLVQGLCTWCSSATYAHKSQWSLIRGTTPSISIWLINLLLISAKLCYEMRVVICQHFCSKLQYLVQRIGRRFDQLHRDNNIFSPADLWRSAILRGYSGWRYGPCRLRVDDN